MNTAPRPDADPERIAHFRILGRLGQGGMGIVYRAEDERLRRTVALKVLPASVAGDPERRARFLREARSAAAIDHPNIATVHEVGEDGPHVYIAMQLVEGETLRAVLSRGPLPPATALRIARGIARGLARAHARGVVHRDLKPDNVVLDADGEPRVLDFGLAKLREEDEAKARVAVEQAETVSHVTEEGKLIGTPGYMAPEQVRGRPVDERADVFALGVVLYEMLSGERPFRGDSALDVLMAVARDPAPPLRTPAGAVPAELAAIVSRCLEKQAQDRYASGREVLEALEHVDPAGARASRGVRLAWLLPVGFVVAVAAGSVAWRALGPGGRGAASTATAPSASSASSAPVTRAGHAMTDHPPPPTSNPEAATAYAAGLRHLRDGEEVQAADDFERACRLDPAMAAAQLRAVIHSYDADLHARREHLAQAFEHRASLDERDRMLLAVAQTHVADVPKLADIERATRAAADRFPDDVEVLDVLGASLAGTEHNDGARAPLEHALRIDPDDAYAMHLLSMTYDHVDKERELELLGRCIEHSPTAGSCRRTRAILEIERGECAQLEDDAKQLAVLEPDGQRTYELLAVAFAARQAPIEGIRRALDRRVALMPDERSKQLAAVQASLWPALLVGDLDEAEKAARRWDDLFADSLVEGEHDAAVGTLLGVLLERGEQRRALELADAYERRVATWTHTPFPWLRMWLTFLRRRAGRIDEATFRRERDEQMREVRVEWVQTSDAWLWFLTNGVDAIEQPEEARQALANLPEGGPPPEPAAAFFVGRVYLLAGQPAAALPMLRRAAGACDVLPYSSSSSPAPTIWWMRAHVALGQALEQTGDRAGACDAYRVVTDRWKDAKPRSVTLEQARQRARALGCPR